MKAAGVRAFGGAIEMLDLPAPRAPRPDEVRIAVRAAGVGNWDEFVRAGSWDVGVRPPMALGVQAAGVVTAAGEQAGGFEPGTLLVHGAGGVTGGLIVQLAVRYGARVVATAGVASADRVRELGASTVVDYHQPDWPDRTRALTGGVDAAVNAAVNGEPAALAVVRDGGRLATITGNPPPASRGIEVVPVLVSPNGARLAHLLQFLADGVATIALGFRYGLNEAAAALGQIHRGSHGAAIVVCPA